MTGLLEVLRKHAQQFAHVDDDLLKIYLRAGIEACELYTGHALTAHTRRKQQQLQESAPETGGQQYLGGILFPRFARLVHGGETHAVPAGCQSAFEPSFRVRSNVQENIDAGCRDFEGITKDWETWPAGLVNGILKYATFAYTHRGDEQANDWIAKSGALIDWRPYLRGHKVMVG